MYGFRVIPGIQICNLIWNVWYILAEISSSITDIKLLLINKKFQLSGHFAPCCSQAILKSCAVSLQNYFDIFLIILERKVYRPLLKCGNLLRTHAQPRKRWGRVTNHADTLHVTFSASFRECVVAIYKY